MKYVIVLLIILLNIPLFAQTNADTNSSVSNQEESRNVFDNSTGDDEISQTYRILLKTGSYEDKKAVLRVFNDNYTNDRVLGMIIDLMTYTYDNPNFKENDQDMFYDDKIAEELIKILGKNGNQKGFPALLKVVLYNRRHRDATVKEAWKAMMAIKW